MTISYPQVLTALKMDSGPQMRGLLEAASLPEQVEIGTFIGPQRLAYVATHADVVDWNVVQDFRATTATLAVISQQAFNAPLSAVAAGLKQELADPKRTKAVAAALVSVEQRRRTGPLLTMSEDVMGILPTPNGTPAPLGDLDYTAAAQRNDLEVAAIKAVAIVESGGRNGFDDQGRPKILFEAHHFGPLTKNRFNKTHPHLACRSGDTATAARYYRWDQYQRLREAMVLDIDAALSAASWGKFQVLGENHNGWPDVRSFVAAMYVSEVNHLKAFEAFCIENGLLDKARRKDWLGFAVGYNGKKQKGYDQKMANAYKAAGGR